jgi:thymidine kinase
MYENKEVILAGLDGDSFQKKFGEILDCIPMASNVTKLSALCMHCNDGTPGPFTKRIVDNMELELIGGNDMYMAVCDRHLKF